MQEWWRQSPHANIAVACGPVSGIVVLDVDSEEGLHLLRDKGLVLPDTRCAKTGRGYHFYSQDPGVKTKNFANGETAFPLPHVDFRGFGGYVVIPPSVHESGRRYEWSNEAPIAPLPSWLRELVTEPDQRQAAPACPSIPPANDPLFERLFRLACERATNGARNEAGLWLACQLRDNGCNQTEAESYVRRFASAVAPCGDHPYTEREALETVRSAFSRAPASPGQSAPTDPSRLADMQLSADTLQPIETWPVLALEAYATLPGELVKAIEPYSEADPVALLINVPWHVGA